MYMVLQDILCLQLQWTFPIYLIVCFIFGCLGAMLGKLMLKKHFAKAGIV